MEEESAGRSLGLIGGLGVGAAIHYYRELARGARGAGAGDAARDGSRRRAARAEGRRVGQQARFGGVSGRHPAAARGRGAEIAALPSVTPLICAAELVALSPLPLVSLPEAILREIERRNLRRVALFGTRFTIETAMFGQLPGVDVVTPAAGEVDRIHEAYREIVETGRASSENAQLLRGIAQTLCDRDGVQAIVLAGTDLAMVFNEANAGFPCVDATQVHVGAIMRALFPNAA